MNSPDPDYYRRQTCSGCIDGVPSFWWRGLIYHYDQVKPCSVYYGLILCNRHDDASALAKLLAPDAKLDQAKWEAYRREREAEYCSATGT